MDVDDKLIDAARALVEKANKLVDESLPRKLAEIVKQHSFAGVAAAWVPVPGLDIAASVAAIWGMYYRINDELQLPFTENVTKSVASGVATNLAAYAGVAGVSSLLKAIPGVGTIAGAVVMSAAVYALTLASGYIYMKVLTVVLSEKGPLNITEQDFKRAVAKVMADVNGIASFFEGAKKSYKRK